MRKNLCKHGNSYALVIDKPILEMLDATPEMEFDIITDGRSLVLSPIRAPEAEIRFEEALASVHKRFGRALKRLSE